MSEESGTPLLDNDEFEYKVYGFRWAIVTLFVVSGIANAIVLLTWAPITDKADDYWNGIGLTAINLLNVIFQIAYLPGTALALRVSEKYHLRSLLITGGAMTTGGCLIRVAGGLLRDKIGPIGSYCLVLFGTAFVGLAQPFYLNMPAKIATTWFAVSQRDIATTLCSLANPLGSAIGSFIPALFVNSDSDGEDDAIHDGIRDLLLLQFGIAAVALVLTFLFFKDEPPTPPTASAQNSKSAKDSLSMFTQIQDLFKNQEYVKLFASFTIVLGGLNAIAALLNQLPGNYSNDEIGATGSALIMSGFCGAFLTGFILDYTKAYSTVLKTSYILTFLCWTLFFVNCISHNFLFFLLSAALLGLATLPTIPSTIMAAVECSYPVPEDASVGFLYIGANLMAIAMTFIGQVLLSTSSSAPAPFFPYGIWMMTALFIAVIPVALFQGKYLRLQQDA